MSDAPRRNLRSLWAPTLALGRIEPNANTAFGGLSSCPLWNQGSPLVTTIAKARPPGPADRAQATASGSPRPLT